MNPNWYVFKNPWSFSLIALLFYANSYKGSDLIRILDQNRDSARLQVKETYWTSVLSNMFLRLLCFPYHGSNRGHLFMNG